jgi:uncharacterized protein (DUF488 family)
VTIADGKPLSTAKSNRIIHSLGSSVRERDQFIRLLEQFRIDILVDVRRFPVSRFGYFCKDKLFLLLNKNKIGYRYLGERLGGFRDKGYQEHTRTREFLSGLEELKDIASKSRTAFMCAERFPWRCHRKFTAQALEREGWQVIHIIDEGKTWEAKPKNLSRKEKRKNTSLNLPI